MPRDVIVLACVHGSRFPFGGKMDGPLHNGLHKVGTTTKGYCRMWPPIQMSADGSSGTADTGWGVACRQLIGFRLRGGGPFGDMRALSVLAAGLETLAVIHGSGRRFFSGLTIHSSEFLCTWVEENE